MYAVYKEFLNGGSANLILLFLGAVGLIVAIAAVYSAAARGQEARTLGIVSVALAIAILSIGAIGVMHGRRVTDAALSGLGALAPTQEERLRGQGYLESKSCAEFGLGCSAIPLFAGAIALLLSSRKRAGDAESSRFAIPGALVAVAALIALGDATLIAQKLPGPDLALDDPAWQLFSAKDDIDAGNLERGCDALQNAIEGTHSAPAAPAKLPDFNRLAGLCIDAQIDAALKLPDEEARSAALRAISFAPPAMLDDAHKKRIQDEKVKALLLQLENAKDPGTRLNLAK